MIFDIPTSSTSFSSNPPKIWGVDFFFFFFWGGGGGAKIIQILLYQFQTNTPVHLGIYFFLLICCTVYTRFKLWYKKKWIFKCVWVWVSVCLFYYLCFLVDHQCTILPTPPPPPQKKKKTFGTLHTPVYYQVFCRASMIS